MKATVATEETAIVSLVKSAGRGNARTDAQAAMMNELRCRAVYLLTRRT